MCSGAGGRRLGARDLVEVAVAEHRQPDQLLGRERQPRVGVRGVLLADAQQPREAAYVARVEAAERPEQQRLGAAVVDVVGGLVVVVVDVDRGAQRVEQRQHGRVLDERAGRRGRPRPGRRPRRGRDAAAGCWPGRSAPARPSGPTGRRPRGGPGGAGRRGARPRRARCRRCSTATRPSSRASSAATGREERLAGRRRRWRRAARCRPATRWVATSSRGPNRRVVRSGDHRRGRAVGAREVGGELEDAAHLGTRGSRRSTGAGRRPRPGRRRRRRARGAGRPGRGRCPGTRRRTRGGTGARSSSRWAVASITARRIRSA